MNSVTNWKQNINNERIRLMLFYFNAWIQIHGREFFFQIGETFLMRYLLESCTFKEEIINFFKNIHLLLPQMVNFNCTLYLFLPCLYLYLPWFTWCEMSRLYCHPVSCLIPVSSRGKVHLVENTCQRTTVFHTIDQGTTTNEKNPVKYILGKLRFWTHHCNWKTLLFKERDMIYICMMFFLSLRNRVI